MSVGPAGDSEITECALAASTGDRTAQEQFIRATQRDVWRFIRHLAGPADADDLVQETYLRALRSLPRFAARSSAKTWLLSIARRVVVDQIRTARARPRQADVGDWQVAAERAHSRGQGPGFDEGVLLAELLDSLPSDRREAFVLTQELGLSYAETAEVCDCAIGTVRSRVARAREDLITLLREANGNRSAG